MCRETQIPSHRNYSTQDQSCYYQSFIHKNRSMYEDKNGSLIWNRFGTMY